MFVIITDTFGQKFILNTNCIVEVTNYPLKNVRSIILSNGSEHRITEDEYERLVGVLTGADRVADAISADVGENLGVTNTILAKIYDNLQGK